MASISNLLVVLLWTEIDPTIQTQLSTRYEKNA